jgi:ABC-type Fe3+/spermidine/putrescine transport system ATPase subunit
MSKQMVQVQGISKKFGSLYALNDVSFDIGEGEFFAVIGPSGCGKTTLLKVIAGLEKPDAGKVLIDGVDVTDVPTAKRGISLVFQDYALFPHKTVFENIAFGLRMRNDSLDSIKAKVNDTMKLVGLEGLSERLPRQLSGGQQQRVAVARSLVIEPKVLLFDEPLGNLDFKLQKKMEVELKFLQERIGVTALYVTHNQEQAMVLGRRIVVINRGFVEQIGTPEQVYTRPYTIFVSKFVGEVNMVKGKVTSVNDGQCTVQTDLGSFTAASAGEAKVGMDVAYAIRPENILIGEGVSAYKNRIKCRGIKTIYKGSEVEYLADLNSHEFKVIKQGKSSGDSAETYIGWLPEDAIVIVKPSVVENIDIDRVLLGA